VTSKWVMREEGMDDEGGATALAPASTPHWMARRGVHVGR